MPSFPFIPEKFFFRAQDSGFTLPFFQHLKKWYATSFCPPWFLMKNPLSLNWFSLIGKVFLLSHYFQDLFLCLVFRYFTMMCLGVDIFRFISYCIISASYICRFMSFVKLRKFQALCFKHYPSSLLPWDSSHINVTFSIRVLQVFEIFFHLFPV